MPTTAAFAKLVLPELVKHGTAASGMKPMANGIICASHTVSATECLHYALNLPVAVLITGVDSMAIPIRRVKPHGHSGR